VNPVYVGVDGYNLPPEYHSRYSGEEAERRMGRQLSPGEIGCYASHISIWREMVDNRIDQALVIESDADLTAAGLRVIDAALRAPVDWDLIQLCWGACIPSVWGSIRLGDGYRLIRFARRTFLTAAYLISKTGAGELLRHSTRICMPVDFMMFGGKINKDIEIFGIYPRVIGLVDDEARTSSLNIERDGLYDSLKGADRKKGFRTLRRSGRLIRHFRYRLRRPPSI